MIITPEVFFDYLQCKYKAYCKLKGEEENKSTFENLQEELEAYYQGKAILHVPNIQDENVLFGFCKNKNVSRKYKLYFVFEIISTARTKGKIYDYGKIIYGENFSIKKISTHSYINEVEKIIEEIRILNQSDKEPIFEVEDRCRLCGFCKAWAKEKDDLSLLRGMRNKDIIKQHKKGIFTVTQYSYTFRPKKKRKRVKNYLNSYLFELKALAIKEDKIFIYEEPHIPQKKVDIFFDIEGSEDNFYYLIGIIIVEENSEKHYSFWANKKSEEEIIFRKFLNICSNYKDFNLFHYGSYETTYLKRLRKRFPKKYDLEIDNLLEKSVNILNVIYSTTYFPTYSNELKDIAKYLNFNWTEENASGLQSLVWRYHWEMTGNNVWKQKITNYNIEDCLALQKITKFLFAINNSQIIDYKSEKTNIIWTKDIKSPTSYRLGKANFFFPELNYINKCAYFNYQREKIFIHTTKNLKRDFKNIEEKKEKLLKIDGFVEIKSLKSCPNCSSSKVYRHNRYKKVVYDLKFFLGGVKRYITKYTTVSVKCQVCKSENLPDKYKKIQTKYGHNLISWAVYQIVANGVSLERIAKTFDDIFDISLPYSTLQSFKSHMTQYYQKTYENLSNNVTKGKLIHADETRINLKNEYGYVWVFTNMEHVIFTYKDTREGNFLKDFLIDFKGVLVADFYAAYDSLKCRQQKCLIHLIRDLNHDLFKNPFDEELKYLTHKFALLLKNIMETVDKYGLNKERLKEHKNQVILFFNEIEEKKYTNEVTKNYEKRFKKNKEKLFTFLDYDSIPWNNNNAEHALKHFATYRKVANGLFTKSAIQDYLVLLSLYQTCKYKRINFLQFLLSKKTVIKNI